MPIRGGGVHPIAFHPEADVRPAKISTPLMAANGQEQSLRIKSRSGLIYRHRLEKKRYSGSTINDQIKNIDAMESTKPAVSRLDWRKYGQKSISYKIAQAVPYALTTYTMAKKKVATKQA